MPISPVPVFVTLKSVTSISKALPEPTPDAAVSAGNLMVTGGAKVTVQADADNGTAADSGALTMHADSTINAGTGVIDLDADEFLTITGLKSTNTGADAIQITSRRAGIVDAGDSQVDITANAAGNTRVTITAAAGVGSGNALEIDVTDLSVTNTGTGDIGILIHPLPLAVRLPSISIVPPSKSIDPMPVAIPLSISRTAFAFKVNRPPSVSIPLPRTCKLPLVVVIVFAPVPALFRERPLVVFAAFNSIVPAPPAFV
jgi:hypothetical protein